jgi:pimeloyl-ACP methyl ester carboxylesterase
MQKGYLDGPHGQIHYWIAGEGPNLVLLHQAAQTSQEYLGLVPYLAADYRIIAIDQPGHGQSDDPPQEYQMEDYIKATQVVLDGLNIQRCALGGHHGGSSIALGIAAQQPERVSHLVLSGCGIRSPEETQRLLNVRMTRDIPLTDEGDFLIETWRRYVKLTDDKTEALQTFVPFLVSLTQKLRPYDAHDAILRWDKGAVLDQIECPVLLMQGSRDEFVKNQDVLCGKFKNARREVLEGPGAFVFYEAPQAAAKLIADFLAE